MVCEQEAGRRDLKLGRAGAGFGRAHQSHVRSCINLDSAAQPNLQQDLRNKKPKSVIRTKTISLDMISNIEDPK